MISSNQNIGAEWELVLVLIVAAAVGLTVGLKLFRWEKEEKIRKGAKLWVAAVILPFLIWGVYNYVKNKGAAPAQWPQQKGTGSLHRDNRPDHRPRAS